MDHEHKTGLTEGTIRVYHLICYVFLSRDLNRRPREELRGTISHANHLVIEDALAYPVFLVTPARVIDWSRRIK